MYREKDIMNRKNFIDDYNKTSFQAIHNKNNSVGMFEHLFENSLNELYIFHPHTLKFVGAARYAIVMINEQGCVTFWNPAASTCWVTSGKCYGLCRFLIKAKMTTRAITRSGNLNEVKR